ncbi:hypothetical protein M9H77_13631 [Catharanthus roseus]|uniref:Uncharacterized protein n=1 Tax=Catharanthus roseus TaxID=4058 RepID=A0ACC0BKQ3_CATRO|nr:hypothetical protein M9H77_13631 [Catharanthus roseus]
MINLPEATVSSCTSTCPHGNYLFDVMPFQDSQSNVNPVHECQGFEHQWEKVKENGAIMLDMTHMAISPLLLRYCRVNLMVMGFTLLLMSNRLNPNSPVVVIEM